MIFSNVAFKSNKSPNTIIVIFSFPNHNAFFKMAAPLDAQKSKICYGISVLGRRLVNVHGKAALTKRSIGRINDNRREKGETAFTNRTHTDKRGDILLEFILNRSIVSSVNTLSKLGA